MHATINETRINSLVFTPETQEEKDIVARLKRNLDRWEQDFKLHLAGNAPYPKYEII